MRLYKSGTDPPASVIAVSPYPPTMLMVVACHDVQVLKDGPNPPNYVSTSVDSTSVTTPNNKNVYVSMGMPLADRVNVCNASQVSMHIMGTV